MGNKDQNRVYTRVGRKGCTCGKRLYNPFQSPQGFPGDIVVVFCSNTLPSFATDRTPIKRSPRGLWMSQNLIFSWSRFEPGQFLVFSPIKHVNNPLKSSKLSLPKAEGIQIFKLRNSDNLSKLRYQIIWILLEKNTYDFELFSRISMYWKWFFFTCAPTLVYSLQWDLHIALEGFVVMTTLTMFLPIWGLPSGRRHLASWHQWRQWWQLWQEWWWRRWRWWWWRWWSAPVWGAPSVWIPPAREEEGL